MSLEVTGLAELFGDRVFSAEQVKHGKPAPDLYLFAARSVGARPADCIVIEDSTLGIRAAVAAVASPRDVPYKMFRAFVISWLIQSG